MHAGIPPPKTRHPPPAQSMLGGTVNARAVRILLECNLVIYYFNYHLVVSVPKGWGFTQKILMNLIN